MILDRSVVGARIPFSTNDHLFSIFPKIIVICTIYFCADLFVIVFTSNIFIALNLTIVHCRTGSKWDNATGSDIK